MDKEISCVNLVGKPARNILLGAYWLKWVDGG
jgi:hypothetical protein